MIRLSLLFLIVLLPIFSNGNQSPLAAKKQIPLKADTTRIDTRKFDQEALRKYAADPDFQYKESDAMSESAWDRFWRWFWSMVMKAGAGMATATFFKYFFIVLGIGALVFLVLKLMGMDLMQILTGKAKQIEVPYDESLENIHEISFDEEIERATNSHNYRLAVRLMYLKCLKALNDAGMIRWQPDKTNAVYISEIGHPVKQQEFRQLTRQFEYIWYGNFPLNSNGFSGISASFHEFNQKTA